MPWTAEALDSKDREIVSLLSQHKTTEGVAQATGLSRNTVQSRWTAARARGWSLNDPRLGLSIAASLADDGPIIATYEDAWQRWRQHVRMARDRYRGPAKPRAVADGFKRYLVLNDIHAPFHEPAMVAAAIERERGRVDECVVVGDLSDSYALSKFVRYEQRPYREEWVALTLLMQQLSEAFPRVKVVIGNHDARLERQLRTHLSEDLVESVRYMADGVLCPITALARKLPNVEVAHHETPSGHEVDWFLAVGDAWLGHPEKYSKVPGSALRAVEEWLLDKEEELGLGRYRLIGLAHTHQYGAFPWRSKTLLIELGCLCTTQGYQVTPRIGGRPQRRGYTVFEQTNGRTDLNSVRFHWFDQDDAFRAA